MPITALSIIAALPMLTVLTSSCFRYSNMDFIVFSSIRNTAIRHLLVLYDIACQWERNLWKHRHKALPLFLQIDTSTLRVDTAIPKNHINGHKAACHITYSLNFRTGVGRTDGEGIERDWSVINQAAGSTKQMTEGARHDTLDDMWGDWNYRKVFGMRKQQAFGFFSLRTSNYYQLQHLYWQENSKSRQTSSKYTTRRLTTSATPSLQILSMRGIVWSWLGRTITQSLIHMLIYRNVRIMVQSLCAQSNIPTIQILRLPTSSSY